jgi:hypothetical protein
MAKGKSKIIADQPQMNPILIRRTVGECSQ